MNWALLVATVVLMVTVGLNLLARSTNQGLREQVAERQTYIAETARFEQINSRLIQALATRAAQADDEQIRRMLAEEGVTFKVDAAVPDPAANPSPLSGEQTNADG